MPDPDGSLVNIAMAWNRTSHDRKTVGLRRMLDSEGVGRKRNSARADLVVKGGTEPEAGHHMAT
jgi:hypothetical protein